MSAQEPPARKIYIFYWRSAKKTHWYNAFVPELEKLIQKYDIDRVTKLKPLDFRFLNINRSDENNWDYRRFASLIDSYRSRKLKKYPLVIIDERRDDGMILNSSYSLDRFEDLLEGVRDYYLQ